MNWMQRVTRSKIFMYGFVLPFWLAIGGLMLLGIYTGITNQLELHVLNASAAAVTVRACHVEVSAPANGAALLSANCFGRVKSLVASSAGKQLEEVAFPDLGERKAGDFIYNVEGRHALRVVDHSPDYLGDIQASLARMAPFGRASAATTLANLAGTRLMTLPEGTTLVPLGAELPRTISKGAHVIRLEE